jgi:hypothetical protein
MLGALVAKEGASRAQEAMAGACARVPKAWLHNARKTNWILNPRTLI